MSYIWSEKNEISAVDDGEDCLVDIQYTAGVKECNIS